MVGTGLYYLRNFNVAGIEGTGWPKFTGGWIFATPADRATRTATASSR